MDSIESWTRDFFLDNQQFCLQKIESGLTNEEKKSLRANLSYKENGKLIIINHFMIVDVKDTEFYCEKYEVKRKGNDDLNLRIVQGKYADKLNIQLDEICENPMKYLGERQTCIIKQSETNNDWIEEYEKASASNKRKIENDSEKKLFAVKVYDKVEIILNDLVEIIGFLYPNPPALSESMNSDELNDDDGSQQSESDYTIHAISFKVQSHNNPLLLDQNDALKELPSSTEIQKDLIKVFTQLLFGDSLSAHYLLCHLISNVYSRVNDEALGKFTLNLICQPIPVDLMIEYVKKLYGLIEMLVPNSLYLPLTIDNLNTLNFVPKKDYTTNRLSCSVLQVPKSTHIVLDEIKLENGKLEQAGCMAIGYFTELIRTQQLSYDFQFYKIPFKTDVPILIISEGKSLLPSDYALPIKAIDADSIQFINETFSAGIHFLKAKLNVYRYYLTKCRLQKFDIAENETKMIETDFVKLRETSNFQVENLHLLLVLSRLLGISQGSKQLNASVWEMAKQMELERIARMQGRNLNEP